MKRINKLLLVLLLTSLTACEEYLDMVPSQEFGEEDVYETYYTAQSYLDNCYRSIFDFNGSSTGGFGTKHSECITDNACTTVPNESFNNGDWYDKGSMQDLGWNSTQANSQDATGTGAGLPMQNCSYALRITNNLLDNIESIPLVGASREEKDYLLGQAYFFRAWFYFEWIRRVGGLPAVNKVYSGGEDLDLPRRPYATCTEDIIDDLDFAIALLPDEWNDANQGRVEKCSAHALKGMVALYAASPLMQNAIGEMPIDKGYDLDWAKRSALYAAATLNYLNQSRSSKNMIDPTGHTQAELDSLYFNVHVHLNYIGQESLFCRSSNGASTGSNARDREGDLSILYQNIRVSGRSGSWGNAITVPSQNLVDAFEMADGTTFDWNNAEHAAKPFENRDPRLYNMIVYPGRQWSKVGHVGTANLATFNTKAAVHDKFYLESWTATSELAEANGDESAKYGLDNAYEAWNKNIPSGYMLKKWWWYDGYGQVGANPSGYGTYHFNSELIRTTQVWLDLAEALNECVGPEGTVEGAEGYTALSCINKIRAKAGMPTITAPGSKDEFRTRIRNERRIELCFEYHRWYDVRRWMMFDEVFASTYPIQGLETTLIATDGTENQENWTYEYETIDIKTATRNFSNKHYWYPIPTSHTDHLMNCEQNWGW